MKFVSIESLVAVSPMKTQVRAVIQIDPSKCSSTCIAAQAPKLQLSQSRD